MIKLSKLLKTLNLKGNYTNHLIADITENSKECIENSIFFVFEGENHNGYDYLEEAIKNGAKTVVSNYYFVSPVNLIVVENLKEIYAKMLLQLHQIDFSKITLIGVTGTNGKTTITTLLHDFLKKDGSLLIGTNKISFNDQMLPTLNTTPCIRKNILLINKAIALHYQYVIMEVSSIGLDECRVFGLKFDYAIYSNITSEHMDYHKTFCNYCESKKKLIKQVTKTVLLNKDDFMLVSFKSKNSVFYSLKDAKILSVFPVEIEYDNQVYKSKLLGEFNVSNLLAVIKLLKMIDITEFKSFLSNYQGVKGRMDLIEDKGKKILIDYAHTPDAVKKVLKIFKGAVVIGCGGNRDKIKRKMISQICDDLSYITIFTQDNKRNESLSLIMSDLIHLNKNYLIIYDRSLAIEFAIKHYDNVLILGKGHETHQIIGSRKYHFSDHEIVTEVLNKYQEKSTII